MEYWVGELDLPGWWCGHSMYSHSRLDRTGRGAKWGSFAPREEETPDRVGRDANSGISSLIVHILILEKGYREE